MMSNWFQVCFHVPGFFKVLAELAQTGDVTAEQFLSKSPGL